MSLYMKCPTCNRLLADKEVIWTTEMENIASQELSKTDKDKAIEELWKILKIPQENYCCKMRIMGFRDLIKIIK